jgi:hypothetical protein
MEEDRRRRRGGGVLKRMRWGRSGGLKEMGREGRRLCRCFRPANY